MKNKTAKLYEVDLYKPIQNYFIQLDYEVYGEVNHCDLIAVKENELIIVELKLNLSVELLIQATKRQRLSENVYIAIPKPNYSLYSKKWKNICYLIRRLELGLIIVSFQKSKGQVEIKITPSHFDRKKSMQMSRNERERLFDEIKGRNGDHNIGGSHKTKIMTAYKEICINIACCFEIFGPLSPKALRNFGTGKKTLSILNKNYYGWFTRIKRGTYCISEIGKKEIKEYPQLVHYYSELIESSTNIE